MNQHLQCGEMASSQLKKNVQSLGTRPQSSKSHRSSGHWNAVLHSETTSPFLTMRFGWKTKKHSLQSDVLTALLCATGLY